MTRGSNFTFFTHGERLSERYMKKKN